MIALRERQKRNFVATLFLSQGVPMLRGGDELSHSQRGNNNAYCQDNEISWLDWNLDEPRRRFLDFVSTVAALKQSQPVLHRPKFFQGRSIRGTNVKDIAWLDPSGAGMTDDGWDAGLVRCIGVRLAGDAIDDVDDRGERLVGDTLLILFNGDGEEIAFTMPPHDADKYWELLFDTAVETPPHPKFTERESYSLHGHSMAVFRLASTEE